jgi:hypothetical protein
MKMVMYLILLILYLFSMDGCLRKTYYLWHYSRNHLLILFFQLLFRILGAKLERVYLEDAPTLCQTMLKQLSEYVWHPHCWNTAINMPIDDCHHIIIIDFITGLANVLQIYTQHKEFLKNKWLKGIGDGKCKSETSLILWTRLKKIWNLNKDLSSIWESFLQMKILHSRCNPL